MGNQLITKIYGSPNWKGKVCRIIALRHVERDKDNKNDPQMPTKAGEIAAHIMGIELRHAALLPNDCYVHTILSSPQPRAKRTAVALLKGLADIDDPGDADEIITDDRLNDFSTDERPEIKAGLEAAKELAKKASLEVEVALFQTPDGIKAVQIKAMEILAVMYEIVANSGFIIDIHDDLKVHLLAGLHGGAIDGALAILRQNQTHQDVPFDVAPDGGLFDKVEGFVADFGLKEGQLQRLAIIRQPAYLKALAELMAKE